MFEKLPPVKVRCSVGQWIFSLSEEDQTNIQMWFDAKHVSVQMLLRQIGSEAQIGFSKETVGNHRRGRCLCSKI